MPSARDSIHVTLLSEDDDLQHFLWLRANMPAYDLGFMRWLMAFNLIITAIRDNQAINQDQLHQRSQELFAYELHNQRTIIRRVWSCPIDLRVIDSRRAVLQSFISPQHARTVVSSARTLLGVSSDTVSASDQANGMTSSRSLDVGIDTSRAVAHHARDVSRIEDAAEHHDRKRGRAVDGPRSEDERLAGAYRRDTERDQPLQIGESSSSARLPHHQSSSGPSVQQTSVTQAHFQPVINNRDVQDVGLDEHLTHLDQPHLPRHRVWTEAISRALDIITDEHVFITEIKTAQSLDMAWYAYRRARYGRVINDPIRGRNHAQSFPTIGIPHGFNVEPYRTPLSAPSIDIPAGSAVGFQMNINTSNDRESGGNRIDENSDLSERAAEDIIPSQLSRDRSQLSIPIYTTVSGQHLSISAAAQAILHSNIRSPRFCVGAGSTQDSTIDLPVINHQYFPLDARPRLTQPVLEPTLLRLSSDGRLVSDINSSSDVGRGANLTADQSSPGLPFNEPNHYLQLYENDRLDRRGHPRMMQRELDTLLEQIPPEFESPPDQREPTPEIMTYPLMEHQRIGLQWLQKLEQSPYHGGILADESGLGKTIQAIALIASRRSTNPQCKTTLIVVPATLLTHWEFELKDKIEPGQSELTIFVAGDKERTEQFTELQKYDVVLTTSCTISQEFEKLKRWEENLDDGDEGYWPPSAPKVPFLGKKSMWYRVILDEAHSINNRTTKSAQGMFLLNAMSRFCLTGTPMMNCTDELQSMIEFIRIKPYMDVRKFHAEITAPLKDRNQVAHDAAMQTLHALLRQILLRRTKMTMLDGEPIVALPERHDHVAYADLGETQRAYYTAFETSTVEHFNRNVKDRTLATNYHTMILLLLRLRRACCHPHLINGVAQDASINLDIPTEKMVVLACLLPRPTILRLMARIRLRQERFQCPICYDAVKNPAIFHPCGHDICGQCYGTLIERSDVKLKIRFGYAWSFACPVCRALIVSTDVIDYNVFRKVHLEDLIPPPFPLPENIAQDPDDEMDVNTEDDVTSVFDLPGATDAERRIGEHVKPSPARLRKEALSSGETRARYARRLERNWAPSAKIEKCCEILKHIKTSTAQEKTVIYSHFTDLLDLLEYRFRCMCIQHARYAKHMSTAERDAAVHRFESDPLCTVLLVSHRRDGVGLNLAMANHIILLDPHWDPFFEARAVNATHCIGQRRPVHVHRILVRNTVEERIARLRDRKRILVDGALGEGVGEAKVGLGLRDLSYLYGTEW